MTTESRSARYRELDLWPTAEAVEAMFEAQLAAAAAVRPATLRIAIAAEAAAKRLSDGRGRLVYAGAGASGRIAVQDGVELGPTFDWPSARLVYLLAGGVEAITASVEGAEDDGEAGPALAAGASIGVDDVVIGVAASGSTPFTLAVIDAARAVGALTIGVAGNPGTPLLARSDHPILLETSGEVLAGSTRMKAGTAQKIALNLFSTAVMIRLGRVHGDLMVAMRLSNRKLRARAVGIVAEISGCSEMLATAALDTADGDIRTAVLVAGGVTPDAARTRLASCDGRLREALRAGD